VLKLSALRRQLESEFGRVFGRRNLFRMIRQKFSLILKLCQHC